MQKGKKEKRRNHSKNSYRQAWWDTPIIPGHRRAEACQPELQPKSLSIKKRIEVKRREWKWAQLRKMRKHCKKNSK